VKILQKHAKSMMHTANGYAWFSFCSRGTGLCLGFANRMSAARPAHSHMHGVQKKIHGGRLHLLPFVYNSLFKAGFGTLPGAGCQRFIEPVLSALRYKQVYISRHEVAKVTIFLVFNDISLYLKHPKILQTFSFRFCVEA